MTKHYEKLLKISKKITKTGRPKQSTQHLKKNIVDQEEEEYEYEASPVEEEPEVEVQPTTSNNILHLSPTCYLILLDEEEYVLVNANYNAKILCGRATCFGCPLDTDSDALEITSKGKSMIPIKAVELGPIAEDLIPTIITTLKALKSDEVKNHTENKIKEFLDQRWDSVLIAITTSQPIKIENITIVNENSDEISPNAILYPSSMENDVMNRILQYLSVNDFKKKILIVGDKNTGKSLLSVYIVNSILSFFKENRCKSAAFYLETDLGQNSFFFPGTVGMFNFKNPVLSNLLQPLIHTPVVYDFVGEFSPQQFTSNYLKAVENCMKFYDYSNINCPLIINSHGYISNIGENILYDLIRIAKPDLVILLDKYSEKQLAEHDYGYLEYNPIAKIEDEIKKRSFYDHKSIIGLPNESYRGPAIWKLELPKFKEAVAHKKEKKDLAMMKYLLNNSSFEPKRLMNIPKISELCLAQPIELSFDEHMFAVLGNSSSIFFFREHFVKFSMIFISSIVSLNYSPYVDTKQTAYTQNLDYQHGLTNSTSKGFGYIRDINPEKRTILVVTPLTSAELSIVNVIVKSSQVQFSNDIYLEDSPMNIENWLNIPAYSDNTQVKKVDKPFINDVLYGVGSESYRNLKSLRKIQ